MDMFEKWNKNLLFLALLDDYELVEAIFNDNYEGE